MYLNKKFSIALLLVFILCSVAFAYSIPPEVKSETLKFFDQYVKAIDDFSSKVIATDNPATMTAAVDEYANKVSSLMKKMHDLEKKYPDFFSNANAKDSEKFSDPDLDKASEKLDASIMKLMETMQKLATYADSNPEIADAIEKLGETMGEYDEKD